MSAISENKLGELLGKLKEFKHKSITSLIQASSEHKMKTQPSRMSLRGVRKPSTIPWPPYKKSTKPKMRFRSMR